MVRLDWAIVNVLRKISVTKNGTLNVRRETANTRRDRAGNLHPCSFVVK